MAPMFTMGVLVYSSSPQTDSILEHARESLNRDSVLVQEVGWLRPASDSLSQIHGRRLPSFLVAAMRFCDDALDLAADLLGRFSATP
jgi:hypothetical protein